MDQIIKYVIRKPVQAVGGALAGTMICLVPGFVILGINEALAPEGNGTTGPLGADATYGIMFSCIAVGIIGGAGLGLYL